jgi:hypothetical protein
MGGLNPGNYGLKMNSPYMGQSYGGYMPEDEEAKKRARWQALASIGQGIGGGSGGGPIGGALSGAGTGAALGTAVAPGVGTAIGAGIGALVGGVGAGIQGGKEEEIAKANAARQDRALDLQEKGMNYGQFNDERMAGLNSLKFLADQRSNAIQRRNRSLFKNDLMRVIGRQ